MQIIKIGYDDHIRVFFKQFLGCFYFDKNNLLRTTKTFNGNLIWINRFIYYSFQQIIQIIYGFIKITNSFEINSKFDRFVLLQIKLY